MVGVLGALHWTKRMFSGKELQEMLCMSMAPEGKSVYRKYNLGTGLCYSP